MHAVPDARLHLQREWLDVDLLVPHRSSLALRADAATSVSPGTNQDRSICHALPNVDRLRSDATMKASVGLLAAAMALPTESRRQVQQEPVGTGGMHADGS